MNEIQDLTTLVEKYRNAAEGTASADPKEANECAKMLRNYYQCLRDSAKGRDAIVSLLGDDNRHVRCWAAAHSLNWAPDIARIALEDLWDSRGPCSFDAKWTLKEFDAGRLRFD